MNNVYEHIMIISISEHILFPRGFLGTFLENLRDLKYLSLIPYLQLPSLKISKTNFFVVSICLFQLVRIFTHFIAKISRSMISMLPSPSWRYYKIYGICNVLPSSSQKNPKFHSTFGFKSF